MSVVSEIITQDQIQDLWGCGFTIVARNRHPDPFHVPAEMVPQGRSYQWWHLVHDKFHFDRPGGDSGWAPVPASRHDGYFMPFGHVGAIEVLGLGLFEKSKFEVDQEREQQKADALKPMQDWASKMADFGFEGGARVVGDMSGMEAVVTTVDAKTGVSTNIEVIEIEAIELPKERVIELVSEIPRTMFPHMSAIFAERDRLKDEVVLPDRSLKSGEIADKFYAAIDADKSLPWWPTLHAILLPIAIENVRKSLKQENGS
jgi:hypothetical protein